MPESFFFRGGTDPLAEATEAAPAAANIGMGWRFSSTVDTVPAGERQRGSFAGTASIAGFTPSIEPSAPPTFDRANWRTPVMYGVLPAGVWRFSLRLRGFGGAASPSTRMRWRISKGRTPATATAMSGVIVGIATPTLGNGNQVSSTATWNAPEMELDNERLFIHQAIEARENLGQTADGSGNQRDIGVVIGSLSFLEVPDLLPFEFVGAVML